MTPPEPDYHTWLEEHGHSLTPEQYAGHRNLLEEVVPLHMALDIFMRRHDHGGSFPDAVLTKEQRATLNEAVRILKRLEYPVALLGIRPPKPMLKLKRK